MEKLKMFGLLALLALATTASAADTWCNHGNGFLSWTGGLVDNYHETGYVPYTPVLQATEYAACVEKTAYQAASYAPTGNAAFDETWYCDGGQIRLKNQADALYKFWTGPNPCLSN